MVRPGRGGGLVPLGPAVEWVSGDRVGPRGTEWVLGDQGQVANRLRPAEGEGLGGDRGRGAGANLERAVLEVVGGVAGLAVAGVVGRAGGDADGDERAVVGTAIECSRLGGQARQARGGRP